MLYWYAVTVSPQPGLPANRRSFGHDEAACRAWVAEHKKEYPGLIVMSTFC